MACQNCGHDHNPPSFLFCNDRWCTCSNYTSDGMEVVAKISATICNFSTNKEIVEYMLKDVSDFRNLSNRDFVFTFWHYVHGYSIPPRMRKELTDPETIRRVKQKLVEENPAYAPTEEITIEKIYKKWGVEEWVTQ